MTTEEYIAYMAGLCEHLPLPPRVRAWLESLEWTTEAPDDGTPDAS